MDDATGRLMIATPQAAAAMSFARQLVITGTSPPDAQPPQIASLFNEGKAAVVMSGPWFIPDIAPNVPWAVAPLPIVSATGKLAAPFLGAEGILMSAHAHDKDAAFAVMDALTGDVAAIERARMARQVVANKAAWDDPKIAADPVLRVFRDQVMRAVPMPKNAGMRSVWTPYRAALGEVIAGRREPGEQLLDLEHEIAGYLRVGS
jgi:maltose-binding protein MalE